MNIIQKAHARAVDMEIGDKYALRIFLATGHHVVGVPVFPKEAVETVEIEWTDWEASKYLDVETVTIVAIPHIVRVEIVEFPE